MYEGLSAGAYSDSDGGAFFIYSDVEAVADFADRSIRFTTTGTVGNDNIRDFSNVEMPDLDMTGRLTYEAGTTSHFTGSVETTGGMTGTANGLFYGPAAQEIGGTFATQGAGVEAYIGVFGAAR